MKTIKEPLPHKNPPHPSLTSMTIGLIAHAGKEGAAQAVELVVKELQRKKISFLMEKDTAALIGKPSNLDERTLAKQCDILLVMGGDGSILRALHQTVNYVKPIFGLNIGSLGFLTCLNAQDYKKAIQCLAEQSYVLSYRSLLEVTISNKWKKNKIVGNALNDVVISRGERSRLVSLSVFIDDVFFTEYHADGLIIATPTGSTAYSLAAGGPVVVPESHVLLISPICPHAFSNRSMVISDQSKITIQATGSQEVFMSLDGCDARLLQPDESLLLSTAPQKLPLVMLPETTFAEVLCQKLQWTGSNLKNKKNQTPRL
ncbi:MAG: NAD(+)/NADH kinase [Verrucomicrobiae bacterium]|jgi:NAD+ kinase|nr:NAD(+)/NADH kinase [Verrucomicrobiae bacterium]